MTNSQWYDTRIVGSFMRRLFWWSSQVLFLDVPLIGGNYLKRIIQLFHVYGIWFYRALGSIIPWRNPNNGSARQHSWVTCPGFDELKLEMGNVGLSALVLAVDFPLGEHGHYLISGWYVWSIVGSLQLSSSACRVWAISTPVVMKTRLKRQMFGTTTLH